MPQMSLEPFTYRRDDQRRRELQIAGKLNRPVACAVSLCRACDWALPTTLSRGQRYFARTRTGSQIAPDH